MKYCKVSYPAYECVPSAFAILGFDVREDIKGDFKINEGLPMLDTLGLIDVYLGKTMVNREVFDYLMELPDFVENVDFNYTQSITVKDFLIAYPDFSGLITIRNHAFAVLHGTVFDNFKGLDNAFISTAHPYKGSE